MFGFWKNLGKKAPVTEPGTRWFNGVTNFVTSLSIRYGNYLGIDRPDEDMRRVEIVIPHPVLTNAIEGGGFPWGSQFPWGFQFVAGEETTSFRVHNPMMRVGPTFYPALVADGMQRYATVDVTTAIAGGYWGVALDMDWAVSGYDAELVIVATEADLYAQESPSQTSSPDRIPIAWFNGTALVRDYIHGALYPQVWVDPS